MRKLLATLGGLLLLCSFIFAQAPKTPREQEGFRGKVRAVIAQAAKLSNKDGQWLPGEQQLSYTLSYDEQGNPTERVRFDYRGNMGEKDVYLIIDGDLTAKTQSFQHDYDPPPPMLSPAKTEPKPRDLRYDRKYKFKYEGNTVERATYRNDGSLSTRTVYTYDRGKKGQGGGL